MRSPFIRACSFITLLIAGGLPASGQDFLDAGGRAATDGTVAAGVGVAMFRSNIDAVVLRKTINPNLLKGGFGEEHMNRQLARFLDQGAGWSRLQARVGSQGIDGLSIRFDVEGRPTGLRVSEAKYESSQLKQTADGIQMGKPWRDRRLAAMSRNYRAIADSIASKTMRIAGPGGSVGKQRVQIALPGSRKAAVFARAGTDRPWEFVGPRRLLDEAGRQAGRIGDYLQGAGRGEVAYESLICRYRLRDGILHVRIKDADSLGAGLNEAKLATRNEFKFRLTDRQLANGLTIVRGEMARQLRSQNPHLSVADANSYARQMVRSEPDLAAILEHQPGSARWAVARSSAKVGGAAALLDVVAQITVDLATVGRVRWREVAISGGIAFGSATVGAAAGQATTALIVRSPAAQQLIARSSAVLGVGSARLLPRLIGGTVGGGVASVLIAVGGYATGTYDAQTAARMGITGVSSTMLGLAASGGLFALATTIGTASTGTAIATLHGAAATSAALAWLGGGTVAAGGFGAAGGAAVLTGGAAVIIIGTGILINYAFAYWDEGKDLERIRLTVDRLARKTSFVAAGPAARSFVTTRIGSK